MFKINSIQFITIDLQYLKALHTACPEVYYRPYGYGNKPHIGILINEDNRSYVIPLSSAKEKHKTWKNTSQDYYLLYEYEEQNKLAQDDIWVQDNVYPNQVKHILSVLDIKKMIPIKNGVYTFVNINPDPSDTPDEIKYKDLLNKEYSFISKIINKVVDKANKIYSSQKTTGVIRRYGCNFSILEQACDNYTI